MYSVRIIKVSGLANFYPDLRLDQRLFQKSNLTSLLFGAAETADM